MRRFLQGALFAAAVIGLPALGPGGPAHAQSMDTDVDVELQLLVDVSGSVNTSEFILQRDGYVNAFQNQNIKDAITGGDIGKIAVQLIYWSGSSQQQVAVDWAEIGSDTEADTFATAIANANRPFTSGSTAPGSAIDFGLSEFANNGFDGTSKVMDVSGDGAENTGSDTATARDNALASGIDRINGLAIGGSAFVEQFFQDEVVGGTDSFFVAANDFNAFGDAVALKLETEIRGETPVPAPAALWLLGFGLLSLGAFVRRRQVAA